MSCVPVSREHRLGLGFGFDLYTWGMARDVPALLPPWFLASRALRLFTSLWRSFAWLSNKVQPQQRDEQGDAVTDKPSENCGNTKAPCCAWWIIDARVARWLWIEVTLGGGISDVGDWKKSHPFPYLFQFCRSDKNGIYFNYSVSKLLGGQGSSGVCGSELGHG